MDDKQRKHIIQNVDRLINLTDFEMLCKACIASEMLSKIMVQNIHLVEPSNTGEPFNEDSRKKERHKKLFEKITKRGPHAYEKLRLIFHELQYNDALNLLSGYDDDSTLSIHKSKTTGVPTTTPNTMERHTPLLNNTSNEEVDQGRASNQQLERINSIDTLHEYVGDICPKKAIAVKKSSRINKHPSIETYPMESKDTRGVFFMVNIIDFPKNVSCERRDGADEDAHSLLHLFKELGFKLFSYTNITQEDFWKILNELLNSEYTKHTECFVMALMTHGNMDDGVQRVAFGDGSVVKVKDIEQRFYHHICPNLMQKPKIFLFPFCRGDISEKGVTVKQIQTDSYGEPRINNIAQLSDVCICYATSEDHKAHRDPEDGSWYIQYFVKNMAELAHDTAFEDIIKKIQADTLKLRTAKGNLQTANYVNKSFNKILYFNPGFYIE